ncbi:MAG: lytic transglycosylase domain-containing protein [Sporolactobacillus sp.]
MVTSINPDSLTRLLTYELSQNKIDSTSDGSAAADSSADFSLLLGSLLHYIENQSQTTEDASTNDSAVTASDALWSQLSAALPAQTQTLTNATIGSAQPLATTNTAGTASSGNYGATIQQMAEKYGVSPALIHAVMDTESGGNKDAVSSVGAQGLMQLMPATAQALGVTNTFDPSENIEGGTKYLSQLLNEFQGNTRLALAAYNAGSGSVKKYGDVPPYPETQAYVTKVMNKMQSYSV